MSRNSRKTSERLRHFPDHAKRSGVFVIVMGIVCCCGVLAGAAEPVTLRDCPAAEACPDMIALPAAPPGFAIGSPEQEKGHRRNEKQHAVSIKPFAIGKYEITTTEYLACVKANGCRPPEWAEPNGQHNIETGTSRYYKNLGHAITDARQPIVGVSHDDAVAYTRWLSAKTGKTYRLPSEAEWEYAARAGTSTAYWWGEDIRKDGKVWAACRGCGSEWDASKNAPVDAFAANPWGLHNIHGNVWEWVADFYCETYASGPADGSARLKDDCVKKDADGLRVLRGGSSFYDPALLRSALRLRNFANFRNFSVGFRVAREVQP